MTDAPGQSLPRKPMGMRRLMGWGILGQLVYVASQFVTLVALTRFASVEQVGLYGLAAAGVLPIFFFCDLSMRVNVAASTRSGYSFDDFRTLLLVSLAAGYTLVVVLALGFFTGTAQALVLILGLTKLCESLSDFAYGVFQRFDRMRAVAASLMLRSLGGTLVFVALLVQGASVEAAFAGQMAVWATVALGVDHLRARRLWRAEGAPEGRDPARMKDLAGHAALLACSGLLSALQGNMPRYVIAWLLSTAALGQFTVVAYAMQAISTVMMAATQSLVSRVNGFIEDRRRDALFATLRKLLTALGLCAVLTVGVCIGLGDWLVEAVFGADYAGLGGLLAICVLAAFLRAVVLVLQMCLLAARRFRQNLMIRAGSLLAMLVCCLAGGALGALPGVAWGMCAAFVLHIAALGLAVRPLGRA